ncbi:MAG: polysaccharide biosynthesis protein [Anaerovoracaceae bacterium]|nr:polysaccharide biosynthesis protein [Anaerovoracaceae bacterium]
MTKKSLIKGAAILAVSGILVKFMGAFFRIPLANLIGDIGMAYYSPAYAIYSFLLVFATAGLPVAISKMVSERCAIGQFREAERVFKLSRNLMITIGAIGFLILFLFSEPIAEILNVPGSALSMQATAPALLLVPIMSSYRGYFQGMQEMTPTAVSQVIEQLFRVVVGLSLAVVLSDGMLAALESFTSEEKGAAGGCFGASAGAFAGLITMLAIYLFLRKRIKDRIRRDKNSERESGKEILKKIAAIAVPITIGAAIMPIMNLIDSGIINGRLMASGWSRVEAESMYGQFMGFASPIVQFPLVLMQAIVISLVPMVSASNRTGNRKELHNNISLGLRMTTIIAIPSAVGMLVLAAPILLLLYPAQEGSALGAAPCLQVMALGFVFLSVITTATGALQGIGKQVIPVINLFISVLIKFAITWMLVSIPSVNVVGAAIGNTVAYILASMLDIAALKKFSGVKLSVKMIIVKPLISALVMGAVVFFAYKGLFMLLGSNGIATIISVFVGIAVYGIMVLKTKTIERDEMMSLSAGRKIAAICDKLRLW